MTNFGAALTKALGELGWNNARLAEAAGFDSPRISRYIRGKIPPTAESVQALCRALPAAQRAIVLVGFLEDVLPEADRDLVVIQAHSSHRASENALPAKVRRALKQLEAAAGARPEVGELVVLLANCVTAK